MDKILLVGCSTFTDRLIECAKKHGVRTIVTDNLPVEQSPIKKLADEYWDIDVKAVDKLVEKCKQEGVTAVLPAASEFCTEYAMSICEQLKLPYYCSKETWDLCGDKQRFKDVCIECGVPVAKDYTLSIEFKKEDLEKVEYPVIVKPVDGNASQGVHLCNCEDELREYYMDAYHKSALHKVVVEQYIQGEEVALFFSFNNGDPALLGAIDCVYESEGLFRVVMGFLPSSKKELYEKQWKEPLFRLFDKIGCKHGVGFVQLRVSKEKCALLEMNYRLPGSQLPEMVNEAMCEEMISFATKQTDVACEIEEAFWKLPISGYYVLWLNPGTIGSIEGVEQLQREIPDMKIQIMNKVGDIVEETMKINKFFGFIEMKADSSEQAAEYIQRVNKLLKIKDENGIDMLKKYDYQF